MQPLKQKKKICFCQNKEGLLVTSSIFHTNYIASAALIRDRGTLVASPEITTTNPETRNLLIKRSIHRWHDIYYIHPHFEHPILRKESTDSSILDVVGMSSDTSLGTVHV